MQYNTHTTTNPRGEPTSMMDIHCHSDQSDGTATPSEIVALAAELELNLIALTDHDTIGGQDAFLSAARKADIPALSGLEADARCDAVDAGCEIHLLGYGFRHDDPRMARLLENQRKKRNNRNQEILDLLAEKGYPVTLERSDELVVNRMHIAQALIDAGHAMNVQDAFARFLGPGGLARLDVEKLSAATYIQLVHELGGVVVWAHPLLMRGDWRKALDSLCALGLDGMEVYYPAHRTDGVAQLRKAAVERKLMTTAGSDFHGANRAHVQYGVLAELAALDPQVQEAEKRLTALAQ